MKRKKSKYTLMLVCLLVTVSIVVGGTIAYLFTESDPVVNTFTPVEVDNEIHEVLNGDVKKDVQIENTGTTDAYIRAKVVVTWQNEDGEVYPVMPLSNLKDADNPDYNIAYNTTDWSQMPTQDGDGYWYYNASVAPDALTTNLIVSATPIKEAPAEGYTLHIEILSQAIQSAPASAVQEAWGMTYTEANGTGTWAAYDAGNSN